MSAGRKKRIEKEATPDAVREAPKPEIVRVSTEEFMEICHRVHDLLMARTDRAKKKSDARPSAQNHDKYIENSKEVFVFVHLMELVENMTAEIGDLRQIIAGMGEGPADHQNERPRAMSSVVSSTPKKTYLN
jgi:hypothetical protein